MKILYSHRIQSRDGQGVHLDSLVAALRANGHEVLVVGPSFYGQAGFGGGSKLVALVRRLLPGAAGELAELAYNLPAYWRLWRAARRFGPAVIYERANLFHFAGVWLARRRRLPLLLEVNSPLAEERGRFGGLRFRRLAGAAERHVWRAADRVLPVTEVLAGEIAAAGVPRGRIVVVPNGIDLAAFAPPPCAPATRGTLTLGFVGFVRPWHGLDAVIRALAAWRGVPALRLVVAGDGPARSELEALAAACGAGGRVHFTGLVERDAVPALVASFDIALQPAAVAYASPLKVFEYMAAGRPIVAPDQPNIREVLAHEQTALLFDPAVPGAMWRAVEQLAADPALRARLGAAARAALLARDLTWAGNAQKVAALAAMLVRQAAPAMAALPVAEERGT